MRAVAHKLPLSSPAAHDAEFAQSWQRIDQRLRKPQVDDPHPACGLVFAGLPCPIGSALGALGCKLTEQLLKKDL